MDVHTSVIATQLSLLLNLLSPAVRWLSHTFLAQITAKVPWEMYIKILWNCHRLERSKATLREPKKKGKIVDSAVWVRNQAVLKMLNETSSCQNFFTDRQYFISPMLSCRASFLHWEDMVALRIENQPSLSRIQVYLYE